MKYVSKKKRSCKISERIGAFKKKIKYFFSLINSFLSALDEEEEEEEVVVVVEMSRNVSASVVYVGRRKPSRILSAMESSDR